MGERGSSRRSFRLWKLNLSVAAVLVATLGCALADKAQTEVDGAPSDRLRQLADDYLEAWVDRNPEAATFWGVPSATHDRLIDESDAARSRWHALEDRFLGELDALPVDEFRGTPQEPLYAVFRDALDRSVGLRVCQRHLWDLHQMLGWQSYLISLARMQPVGDDAARAAALSRLEETARFIDQEIVNLRRGLEAGYAAPRTVAESVRRQVATQAGQAVEEADLLDPFRRDPHPPFADSAAVLWNHLVAPALGRMAAFLEQEYEPRTRETDGIGSLPDSEACYRAQVRYYTTLDEDPDVLFERGRRVLAELMTARDSLAAELGYESAAAAMAAAKEKPENRFTSREDMLAFAQGLVAKANDEIPAWFGRLPQLPLVVESFPASVENSSPGGQYLPGSIDDSRPGIYRLNTANWANASGVGLETLTWHEGIPGHHLQLSLALERPEAHPLTRYLFNSGFGEGWALYTEILADEMGLFSGPEQRLAMYNSLIFRAGRLVVDPGLHAKGWTRDEALQLFSDAMDIPHGAMANEVDRYMAGPGQATAYLTGMLIIQELRDEAEARLGEDFDIRRFHDLVLEDGAVPVDYLRMKIERWIEEEAAM